MTSIMSRSQGRKSWSMIRSTPAAANRRTAARACSGVPVIQRSRRSSSHVRVVLGAERHDGRGQSLGHLRLVAADEDAGHRRMGHGRRVATDRHARRVHGREGLAGLVRPRRAQVELVRVPGGQPVGARRALSPDDQPRPRSRRAACAGGPGRRPASGGSARRGSRPGGPRTTSRRARPTGRAGSPAHPP